MKKTFIWLVASLLFIVVGCVEGLHEPDVTVKSSEQLPNLTAGFAEGETKTYVESGKYLRWHEDDRLTAFFGNTLNRQYKFNGATGDNSGSFSYISSGKLETGNALDRIYAVYPYDETTTITDDGKISLTLPDVQTYAENSFGRGANTMLAVTENVEDTFLGFKNACGYLKLKLYNPEGATIKSVEVKGNGDEKIAGAATATIAFGEVPQLTMADDATTTIALYCGDGVALGTTAEAATEFWIVIPETTFEGGITITVTDTEGGIFEKSTTKEVAVERNAIQPMAALEVVCIKRLPKNNKIWYTATEKVEPYDKTVFGATYQSNEWNSATGEGVITFDNEVTMIGDYAFNWFLSLTSVTIPDSVTSIGESAFANCWSLTSVIIPDSVTSIGESAFYECSSITNITIPDSVTAIGEWAFANCSSLTSITIPDSVTSIGGCAFSNCTSLTNVTIPDSVTAIGDNAFSGCTSLTNVTIPNSVTAIGDAAFSYCSSLTSITIPDSVTSIGNAAFQSCTSLTSVTIPDSVTSIGYSAFAYCSSLSGEIVLPMNLNKINSCVFCGCSKVSSFVLPGNLNEIGDGAFAGCSSFSNNIILPSSVITIGESAFENCASLAGILIPRNVERIGTYAFKGCSGELTVECEIPDGLNSRGVFAHSLFSKVTIGDEVQRIGINAFYESKEIIETTIGSSVTEIGDWAFKGCGGKLNIRCNIPDNGLFSLYDETKFSDIVICEGVTRIGDSAFENDKNIVSVTLPSTITEIGAYAFYKCSGTLTVNCNIPDASHDSWGAFYGAYFTEIHLEENVSKIGSYAFKECRFTEIEFPKGLKEIGAYAFGGCRLTKLSLPDSVIELGEGAFSGCYELSCNINIPQNVTIIHDRLFEDSNICGVHIPDGVTEIGYAAFMGTMLRTITIPASVKKLGYMSLYSDLDSVTFLGTIPPEIDEMSFDTHVDVYVPAAALEIYKSAWPGYNVYDYRIYPM